MLPCVPQFMEYQNTSAVQGQMDRRWLLSYFGLLFAGAPWSSTGQAVSKYMELYPLGGQPPDPVRGAGRLDSRPARGRHSKAVGRRTCPCACRPRALAAGADRVRHFQSVPAPPLRMVFAFSSSRCCGCDRARPGWLRAGPFTKSDWRGGRHSSDCWISSCAYVGLHDAAENLAAQPSAPANPRIC